MVQIEQVTLLKKNNRLPAVVGIDNQNVNMNEMLYLMCKSLNSTSTITSNNYSHISSSTGTNCNNVKIYKNDYLKLSNELIKYYTTNNENPQKLQ